MTREAGCAFCAIAAGEAAAHVVHEDERTLAFLDRRPLFPGHVLVVPRGHAATLPALPASEVGGLFGAVRLVAGAMPGALDAEGTFVAINNGVSQSVPHLHVHVAPRRRGDGLRGFFWPRRAYDGPAHERETAARLREAIARAAAAGA